MIKEGLGEVDKKFETANEKFDKMLIGQIGLESKSRNFVTKDEFQIGKDEILNAVDKLTKKFKNHESEHNANLGAHNRIQGDFNEVRTRVGMKIKHPVLDA